MATSRVGEIGVTDRNEKDRGIRVGNKNCVGEAGVTDRYGKGSEGGLATNCV